MDTREDSFTRVLLTLCTVAGIAMLFIGLFWPHCVYKHICGAICAICLFFLLNNADTTSYGNGMVIFLRILAVVWTLYSLYSFFKGIV